MGGNRRTRRKPTQTQGQWASFTQSERGLEKASTFCFAKIDHWATMLPSEALWGFWSHNSREAHKTMLKKPSTELHFTHPKSSSAQETQQPEVSLNQERMCLKQFFFLLPPPHLCLGVFWKSKDIKYLSRSSKWTSIETQVEVTVTYCNWSSSAN